MLACLAAGCGGTQAAVKQSPSHASSASSTPASLGASANPPGGSGTTSYCGAQDLTIPGAAAYLAGQGPRPDSLTAVQSAWLQMGASMVPACSEIVPDPPPVQTENLTNGELSDAAFQTWVTEDEEWWTYVEWAQQHAQADFITYLLGGSGDTLTAFVRAGGRVVDSETCEYASKYDAVAVAGSQMSDLTVNRLTTPGLVYVGAAVGPCTSTWIASDGVVTHKDLVADQEGREVDVTSAETNSALGQFLVVNDSWDQGDEGTADAILAQVGI